MPDAWSRWFTPIVVTAIGHLGSWSVVVFLFLVGLELDTSILRRHAAGVVRIASASLLVPFAIGVGVAWFLFPSWHGAVANAPAFLLFCGTALAITAMPVLTRILDDLQMRTTTIGTVAIGCAAINDAAAWTLLGVVVSLANGRASPLSTVALAAVYVGVMLLLVRPALDRVASLRARRTGRAGWMACVAVAAAASVIVSEGVGLHAVFGALLAGVCVPRRPDVLPGLDRPLRSLIAPVLPAFFILIGMRTPIGMVAGASGWAVLAGVTLSAAIGKLGPSAVAARFAGFSWRDAFVIGSLLNTRGLVELVALDVGRDLGILSPALFAIFVVMTFVTTFMTTPLVRVLRN
jgi:Kef-type K+ transport system membrane component KefB